jgi:hypothetical protein
MLADSGLRQTGQFDNITGDALFFFGQNVHDSKADRIPEGFEHGSQSLIVRREGVIFHFGDSLYRYFTIKQEESQYAIHE